MTMMISLDRLSLSPPGQMPSRSAAQAQGPGQELPGLREPADQKPGIGQPDLDTYECQT